MSTIKKQEPLKKDGNNTYIIRPSFNQKFRPLKANVIVNDILKERLTDKSYNDAEISDLTKELSKELQTVLSNKLKLERYKIVVQVVIAEHRAQGIKMAARCYWDSDSDNSEERITYKPNISNGLRQNSIQCSGHTRPVVDLHFSRLTNDKSYYVISASKDSVPMLRFGHTGDWIGSFRGHKGAVWSCTLTNEGSKAATGAADFTAKVWDCETGKALSTIEHNHIVRSIEFNNVATQLVTATNKYGIEIHDLSVPGKSVVMNFNGHTDMIHRTLWFDDDKRIISVSKDKTIRLWDIKTGQESWNMTLDHMIYDMDVVGNKLILACGNEVSIWNINSNETEPVTLFKKFATETKILSASLHPSIDQANFPSNEESHNTFVCGGEDFLVYKYNIDTSNLLESCKAHFGSVHCVRYSPDGHLFASGSEDGTLRLWQNVLGENYGLWYLSNAEKSV